MAEHHHDHHHIPQLTNVNKAFWIGIILNAAFVLIEALAGFYYNSLALLSDAGHNLTDVGTLALSLLAFRLAKIKPTATYTYGYRKSTILASLLNAFILLIIVGIIGYEAIHRLIKPETTQGNVIAWIAGIGIIINTVSALLFFRHKEKDLNAKGAYLHLASDALIAFGVVIAGIIISFTKWYWIDPLVSIVMMIIIVISTWSLLSQSFRLTMDAVPDNVDVEKIKSEILKMNGVKNIHHIHIWAMSTTENAMTAHLILENDLPEKQIAEIKHKLKHDLEHNSIQHATLETESQNCHDENC